MLERAVAKGRSVRPSVRPSVRLLKGARGSVPTRQLRVPPPVLMLQFNSRANIRLHERFQ